MGAGIVIGLVVLLALAAGGKGGGGGTAPSGLSPAEDPFDAPGPVVSDRWVGPARLVVYRNGATFGYVAVTNMAALDEGAESIELGEAGFDSQQAAENAGVLAVSDAFTVETHDGAAFFPMVEVDRDGGFYRSWIVKAGANTGLLASLRVADPQSTTSTMTRYKVYDRQGWPSTVAIEASADTDAKMFATAANFLRGA